MAVTRIATIATAAVGGATNDADNTTWSRAAIADARALIGLVPGSGAVRGVGIYGGTTYAVRDNAAGTAGVLWKATSTGWVAQSLGREVAFTSGGTTAIAAGDIITGATSAATAVVGRVIVTSGTWAAGDAAGRLILTVQSGTFRAENLNIPALSNAATIAVDSSFNALPAGGRYEFRNHNFYGASNLSRMYGVNGVGPAFEWDGSVFTSIITGMATDAPSHIDIHKNHLFLSFPGGSVQFSGPGEPMDWTPILGAGEIGIGEESTGLLASVTGTMAIFGRNKISILYGDDAANWNLVPLANEAGAVEWTVQHIGSPIYLDDRGIRALTATQAYGDFRMGTMSGLVEPLFKAKRKLGVTAVGSARLRAKDQYRLFWSDGTATAMYVGRKSPEITQLSYPFTVSCIATGEDGDGNDVAFVGTEDGWVFQLDSGTSFDGGPVEAYARLAYTHVGSPRQEKRWHKAALELTSAPSTSLGITADFSYGTPDVPSVQEVAFSISGGGGAWNEAFWSEFYWSATAEGIADADLEGIGTNISVVVASNSTHDEPYTLHGLTLYHSMRRLVR